MKILAIETSCDDTGVAILDIKGTKDTPIFSVMSDIVASQTEVHQKYGGVFPMMAKREHQKNLVPALIKALKEAYLLNPKSQNPNSKQIPKSKFQNLNSILEREPELAKQLTPFLQEYQKPDVDHIAVTNGPGLEPCLWVGINFARALSYYWNIPIIPVNHIESHILVNYINQCDRTGKCNLDNLKFPAICLVVSGGHTQLILMKKIGSYKILGETRDDAAGECFDKCAKILGLGYPGGPEIAKYASQFKSQTPITKTQINSKFEIRNSKFAVVLPRPMINTKDYDFSFSGLKTAALYMWQKIDDRQKTGTAKRAMAAEIQQAIIDVLIKKTIKAAKDFSAKTIILGGGVSANTELRRQFKEATEGQRGSTALTPLTLIFPPANLSTDNAVMITIAGYFNKKNATSDVAKLKAEANLRISK